MVQQLFILRGIPGSGKSFFAKKWVSEDPENRVRVNRDDLRFMMFGAYELTPSQENAVTRVEHATINAALANRKHVIVDAQNLRAKYVKELLRIAEKRKTVVLHKDFNVDLDVALQRNKNRDRQVPERVIRNTYSRFVQNGKLIPFPELDMDEENSEVYIPDESLPKAILLDVDGTAMHMAAHRGPYDWDKVLDDIPNPPVVETVKALHARGYKIIVMSGRDEVCKDDTLLSLEAAGIPVHEIFMRPEGDTRKDNIVKKELFDAHIRHRYNILVALDDRDQVVDAYRNDLKLPVFQVNYGDF